MQLLAPECTKAHLMHAGMFEAASDSVIVA